MSKRLILIAGCSWCLSASGQSHVIPFINKIREANKHPRICYNYKMYLRTAEGNVRDSITGALYKSGNMFLDSNRSMITLKTNASLCKVNRIDRTVSVYELQALKKQFKMDINASDESIISIPDSVIVSHGKMETARTATGNYLVTIRLQQYAITKAVFEIDEKTLLLVGMRFERLETDTWGTPTGYLTVYDIYNIRRQFNERMLSTDRIYTKAGKEVVLSKNYSQYKLNTLTD